MSRSPLRHLPIVLALALGGASLAISLGAIKLDEVAPQANAASVPPATSFSEAEIADIGTISRDYLLANPEIIREAIQALQAKEEQAKANNQVAAVTQFKEQIFADANAPFAGNPNGDVTVVEFFDYKCPYCKQVTPALEGLLKSDPGLKIVFKEFPILGEPSLLAAKAALAAAKQDKYMAFHTALMAHRGTLDLNSIATVAAATGLNAEQLVNDMQSDEIVARLKANHDLALALSIRSTPTFIVGDKVMPGALSIEELQNLIKDARKGS
jgi:protein-disulfide isomerase